MMATSGYTNWCGRVVVNLHIDDAITRNRCRVSIPIYFLVDLGAERLVSKPMRQN